MKTFLATKKALAINRRAGIWVALLVIGAGLVARAWLSSSAVDLADDQAIIPSLSADFDPILARIDLLLPSHERKRPPQPGDWMMNVPEGGQLFPFYVQHRGQNPVRKEFDSIDIQPLGEFDETQRRIVEQTAEFMGHFFGVPIEILDPQPFDDIPSKARQMKDEVEQVLTTWILFEKLRPNRRPDAMATIALVTCDLWPGGQKWVFGQASPVDRVGVWSLHRNGDPKESDASYRLCLRRTLTTAVHETGHMLGMPHCTAYECGMNGSSSRAENDRRPLEFCPHCQAKIWWSCGADPLRRCRALFDFCDRTGLKREAEMFRKEVKLFESKPDMNPVFVEKTGKNLDQDSL